MNWNKMPSGNNRYTKNVSFGVYDFGSVEVGDTITVFKDQDYSVIIKRVDVTQSMIDDAKHCDDYVLVCYR